MGKGFRHASVGRFLNRLFPAAAILLVLGATTVPAISAEPSAGSRKEMSADELARELANPNTPLASLTLKSQYRLYDGDLPGAGDQRSGSVLFQPSFPMPVGRTKIAEGEVKDMVFFRPAFPLLVEQPVFDARSADFRSVTGMGDIGFDLMLGRSYPDGLVTGAGIAAAIPTGTRELSSGTWTLGPEGVLASVGKRGVAALRVSHGWNVGGSRDIPTSSTSLQPVLVLLPGGGWSVSTSPELSYDWKGREWTVPLNVGCSRTLKVGGIPLKVGVSLDYYVVRPDAFAPEWTFGLNITPVVPNVLAGWLGLDS